MLMYFQDSFARLMTIHNVAAFDIVKQHRMWVITEVQIDVQPTVTYMMNDLYRLRCFWCKDKDNNLYRKQFN